MPATALLHTEQERPTLTLTINPDDKKIITYKIARIIYAETSATSLPIVIAFASMIKNMAASGRAFSDIVADAETFTCLRRDDERHADLYVDSISDNFQMVLRTVRRMMNDNLADTTNGAVRFHRADTEPDWARGLGYVADLDGFLFYRGTTNAN